MIKAGQTDRPHIWSKSMQKVHGSSLLSRSDTMFGVCQGLGEDFGFNPNWLRVAFALMVVFNVGLALSAYAAAGVLVLVSRLVYPDRRKAVAPVEQAAEPVVATQDAAPVTVEAASAEEERVLVAA